jgi:hypothetical protein
VIYCIACNTGPGVADGDHVPIVFDGTVHGDRASFFHRSQCIVDDVHEHVIHVSGSARSQDFVVDIHTHLDIERKA